MKRAALSMGLGYLAMFVVATIIAIAMRPVVSPMFGMYVRTDAEGLAFAPLLAGYLVVTLALGWLVPRVQTGSAGWRHGGTVGTALGTAVFLGDHLITAGWSKLPALPMLLSGVIDVLAVASGGVAIAMIQGRSQTRLDDTRVTHGS